VFTAQRFRRDEEQTMSMRAKSVWAALVLAGWIIPAGDALAADRPAEAILAELDAIKLPTPDSKKMRDQAYRKEHFSKLSEARRKRSLLTRELSQGIRPGFPRHSPWTFSSRLNATPLNQRPLLRRH
jgi:hypothetical protein